jgi:hypothetical protein
MTTYPILDATGRRYAFEVESVYLTLSKGVTVLKAVDGVSNLQKRRLFRRPMDVHVRFRYRGVAFVVWEPYADSSRYWIGPEHPERSQMDVADLQAAFDAYDPPLLLKVLGNLLSRRFWMPRQPAGSTAITRSKP